MVEKMSGSGANSRASNALLMRAESIKKYKLSDTAKEKPVRTTEQFTIQFDKGTVFLSAVASGDLDETESLLDEGVDIDFRNNDGLTALHQACIDENDDMVNLLLERGANIEAVDNEGWTPLHAATSAGTVDIAQILVDAGANLSAVNNEGEVPLDLAEEEEMEDYISEEIDKQELELDDARNEEEEKMLDDANNWLENQEVDEVLDWQGATALHVSAAKGYSEVISTILQIKNIDVNVRDVDGWTPLHAAVHWGSKSACEQLTDAGADFEVRNSNGQTPCDLAEPEFVKTAENCRKRSKDLVKKSISKNSNPIDSAEKLAKQLLNTLPPRSALKGGREKQKSGGNSKPQSNGEENQSEEDEDEEEEEAQNNKKKEESPPAKSSVSVKTSVNDVDNSSKSSVRISRLSRSDDSNGNKDNSKPDSISATFGKSGTLGISRFKQDQAADKPAEPAKTSRFQLPTRPPNRVSAFENKTEEKKPEETRSSLTNRYTSSRFTRDEKDDENSITNRYRSRLTDDDRTRKKDENEASEPETKRISSTSRTSSNETDSSTERKSRVSGNDDESTGRMSIADRLRKKNEELLATTSNDRPFSERSSVTDSYTNRSRTDRSSTSSSVSSIRTSGTKNTTTSSDTGDTKDSQKKLDQALKEVEEYKSKYEKMKKEKEDLEKQLEQYREDIGKMQELKSDNIRLKDENGALIRVISKLSRTPPSTTSS